MRMVMNLQVFVITILRKRSFRKRTETFYHNVFFASDTQNKSVRSLKRCGDNL